MKITLTIEVTVMIPVMETATVAVSVVVEAIVAILTDADCRDITMAVAVVCHQKRRQCLVCHPKNCVLCSRRLSESIFDYSK